MRREIGYLILSWFYICLTTAFVLNRLFVRAVRRTFRLNSDGFADILVVIAWTLVFLRCLCDTYSFTNGLFFDYNKTYENNKPDKRTLFSKILTVTDVTYFIILYCIKLAILNFLLEVTPPLITGVRRAIWVAATLSVAGLMISTCYYIVVYFKCFRDQFAPNSSDSGPVCWTLGCIGIFCIGYHMFTDIFIYIIPFFLVRHLPPMVTRSKRISMYATFGAGFLLVCIALPQLDLFPPASPTSMEWNFWWVISEVNLAITIACLPTLRITAKRILNLRTTSSRNVDEEKDARRRSSIVKIRRGRLNTREVAGTMDITDAITPPGPPEKREKNVAVQVSTDDNSI